MSEITAATGVGSLPGTDIDAAVSLVFSELPELPHLPELPARGAGADMIGRTAGALADLPVDLQPSGWRLVARPGVDRQRAVELLTRDLDALVPVAGAHDYDGPLKVQLAGPWTLAATLQTSRGPVLGDSGATRDVAASLAETVRLHLAEVRRRVPRARLILQLDEPALPSVLAGQVPTASGWGRIAHVEPAAARDVLAAAISAAAADDVPVAVHCCAADAPFALLHEAGAHAISFDLATARLDRDAIGAAIEAGTTLWPGVVPALGPGVAPTPKQVADPVRRLWHELGFPPEKLAVVLTPACGLAGASAGWTRTAMQVLRQAARILTEAPEAAAR